MGQLHMMVLGLNGCSTSLSNGWSQMDGTLPFLDMPILGLRALTPRAPTSRSS